MAEMEDLLGTKQHVEEFVASLDKNFKLNSGIYFPESPNPKLHIQIKHGESIILEMSYWQNNQCRCEAVDLSKGVLIFEDEKKMSGNIRPIDFMCSKVKEFNNYVE